MPTKEKQYMFFLGSFPLLSLGELYNFFSGQGTWIMIDREFALFSTHLTLDKQALYKLGGTIKIAEVVAVREEGTDTEEHALSEFLVDELIANVRKEERTEKEAEELGVKIRYAISVFGIPGVCSLTKLLNYTKKVAKQRGLSARFVNKDLNKNISSVVVQKERLIEKGIDITVCIKAHKAYICRTVASQSFASYSQRDFDKPVRDMRSGIMPPKLAQMMINMALHYGEEGKHLYDPFCGSGTLLMEGLLHGCRVTGSDRSEEAVSAAMKNCVWLKGKYANKSFEKPHIFVHDATMPFPKEAKCDAVVTESYLGPTVNTAPPLEKREEILGTVALIQNKFLKEIANCLPSGGRVVLCFPFYNVQGKYYFVEKLLDQVDALGYTLIDLLPKEVYEALKKKPSKRTSLLYVREDQAVGREIIVLEKK